MIRHFIGEFIAASLGLIMAYALCIMLYGYGFQ